MIDLWLRSGTAGIVILPFVALFAVAAGIVWLTHLSPLRPFFASCIGITGPFFASVAVTHKQANITQRLTRVRESWDIAALDNTAEHEAQSGSSFFRLKVVLGEIAAIS